MINQNLQLDQDTFLRRGIQFINFDSKLLSKWRSILGPSFLVKSTMRILKNCTAETSKWVTSVKQKESSLLLKSLLLCLNKQTKKSFKSWLMKDSQQTNFCILMTTTIMDWAEIGFESPFKWQKLRKLSILTMNERLKSLMIESFGWTWIGLLKKLSFKSLAIYETISTLTETKNTGLWAMKKHLNLSLKVWQLRIRKISLALEVRKTKLLTQFKSSIQTKNFTTVLNADTVETRNAIIVLLGIQI